MVLHIIRVIFVLSILAIAVSYAMTPEVQGKPVLDPVTGEEVGLSIFTKVVLVMLIPVVLAVGLILADMGFHNKSLLNISGLFFGVVAGVFLAYILGMVVDLAASVFIPEQLPTPAAESVRRAPSDFHRPTTAPATLPVLSARDKAMSELRGDLRSVRKELGDLREQRKSTSAATRPAIVTMIKLLVGAFTIYLCVSFVMQTKNDFRFVIPYVEFSKQTKGVRPMLLDTSVIIDGRIADIAETRILEGPMIVPRFVLEEIQGIADSADKLKRGRGRRGLDMLNRLQTNDKIEVRLTDARIAEVEEVPEVDHKLVALAQHLNGKVVTNDYNLNKVAQIRGVEVININDLANALKPVVLPGESLVVKIIKPGEEAGQGVGYLDDGTMVVIEQGRSYVGREMPVEITSTLQTSAGRMIFGRIGNTQNSGNRKG